MSDIGLYIHVPFCLSKCPYCDFYSQRYSKEAANEYVKALGKALSVCRGKRFDSVYFGGGTPILIADSIRSLLSLADTAPGAEITVEANPCLVTEENARLLAQAKVSRVSLGVQSMDKRELSLLGRRHSPEQVKDAFARLHAAGIENISADMMTALPGQDEKNIFSTAAQLKDLGAVHISAYILKVEENTPFYDRYSGASPVSDDDSARLYLYTCETLEKLGFSRYEISNFAVRGYESRHNLRYWRCEEYIGIGAAAHSFIGHRRYHVPADTAAFIRDPFFTVTDDEDAGGTDERIMLGLRLTEGVDTALIDMKKLTRVPEKYYRISGGRLSLTPEGALVSNSVIAELI